jgi:hypothetical protein
MAHTNHHFTRSHRQCQLRDGVKYKHGDVFNAKSITGEVVTGKLTWDTHCLQPKPVLVSRLTGRRHTVMSWSDLHPVT